MGALAPANRSAVSMRTASASAIAGNLLARCKGCTCIGTLSPAHWCRPRRPPCCVQRQRRRTQWRKGHRGGRSSRGCAAQCAAPGGWLQHAWCSGFEWWLVALRVCHAAPPLRGGGGGGGQGGGTWGAGGARSACGEHGAGALEQCFNLPRDLAQVGRWRGGGVARVLRWPHHCGINFHEKSTVGCIDANDSSQRVARLAIASASSTMVFVDVIALSLWCNASPLCCFAVLQTMQRVR